MVLGIGDEVEVGCWILPVLEPVCWWFWVVLGVGDLVEVECWILLILEPVCG